MPCSQWDARRPRSEDVRVIGPLLRFRLLAAAGHPIRRRLNRTNVFSLQWKRLSWCRRGATDYRLTCRSPAPRFTSSSLPPRKRERLFSFIVAPLVVQPSPCTRYTCCLPRIIRPSFPLGRPQLRHRRRHRDSDSLSSQKLPIDYPFSKLDKSLL